MGSQEAITVVCVHVNIFTYLLPRDQNYLWKLKMRQITVGLFLVLVEIKTLVKTGPLCRAFRIKKTDDLTALNAA